VAQIVALGKACEIAQRDMQHTPRRTQELRDRLYSQIKTAIPAAHLNGHSELRLPNTLSISFAGIEANTLLSELSNVAASAGAACHSGDVKVSRVLQAMHVPVELAMGTIRFSTGKFLSENDIDQAAGLIIEAVHKLGSQQSAALLNEPTHIRLTQFTHGLGCACKLRPQVLEEVLKNLPPFKHNDILVGTETSDDAAVYRLSDEMAIVQTLDFFTPVVDDPYEFGAIAAANALSDIYAMGAKPLFALNIAAFPSQRLPTAVLHQILKGAADKAAEAGIPTIGGHTVDDNEPKFGLAATGVVHPQRIWRNAGAQEGDVLILTKPIGTGIISTAVKKGMASSHQQQQASKFMAQLNRVAAETASKFSIHACTDITGFGLLGHLKEMAEASDCTFKINSQTIPLLDGVIELVLAGSVPGGTRNNLEFVAHAVTFDASLPDYMKLICADAQTSGGLLFCVPMAESSLLLEQLHKAGIDQSAIIGQVQAKGSCSINVV
jgi:selenium donor protein